MTQRNKRQASVNSNSFLVRYFPGDGDRQWMRRKLQHANTCAPVVGGTKHKTSPVNASHTSLIFNCSKMDGCLFSLLSLSDHEIQGFFIYSTLNTFAIQSQKTYALQRTWPLKHTPSKDLCTKKAFVNFVQKETN